MPVLCQDLSNSWRGFPGTCSRVNLNIKTRVLVWFHTWELLKGTKTQKGAKLYTFSLMADRFKSLSQYLFLNSLVELREMHIAKRSH